MAQHDLLMQRLSEPTRRVLDLAREESNVYHHRMIGTEHLLLALSRATDTPAGRVLEQLNVTLERMREAVELLSGHGAQRQPAEDIEFAGTQRTYETLQYADRLSRSLNTPLIEPEDLLLALLDIPGSAALGVLQTLGVGREQLRASLIAAIEQEASGDGDQADLPQLTHLDAQGQARMVDVGTKDATKREAIARGSVVMQPSTLQLIMAGDLPKGDVLATARIAGIMAAKKTSDLIPLCHPLMLTHVGVTINPVADRSALDIEATVRTTGKTGVEMEALTAVSVAALTIYDMCKAVDRAMRITEVRLAQKRGGKSGEIVLEP